jgi:hypothetical protein
MPDLYNTDLGANARKTLESTKFGTRELSFHQIDNLDGADTNYDQANSVYYKAVRALQEQVEIYAVGRPSGSTFTVVIAADTCPYPDGQHNGDGNQNGRLQDIVRAATGDSNVRVWNTQLLGDFLNNGC